MLIKAPNYFIHRKGTNLLSTALATHQRLDDAINDAEYKANRYECDMVVTDYHGTQKHEANYT